MQKTSTKNHNFITTNSAIEFVQWSAPSTFFDKNKAEQVLAMQTTRIAPDNVCYSDDTSSPYQAFNLGLHVGDCPVQVEHNRQYLQQTLPNNAKIQWLDQVHGNTVATIDHVSNKAIIADAAITRKKNTCLAIMTADCLPILLVSKKGDEIAAIHGGWRPLAANIITNTLNKMQTSNADICAWLGPCISKNIFEVGDEVKETFVKQDDCFKQAFTQKIQGKSFADLHNIARLQLYNAGISDISSLPECTYSNPHKYYSYRKNAITGRMATLICLV